jgi:phytoene dehydrogenase-like protein
MPVVVGSGPNGLAAAIVLARAGREVTVLEAEDVLGGGCRSAELTLPGYVHDTCATVHALALASPFLRELSLPELVQPEAPLAHPLDDGTAVIAARSIPETAAGLGPDERAYRRVFEPLARSELFESVLAPLPRPRRPALRFGVSALRSAEALARARFSGERARALFAGCAAHSMLPLTAPVSAAFGLVLLASAHAVGWPVARGGSQRLADALASVLQSYGGAVQTGRRVRSLDELSDRPLLLDVTPRQLLAMTDRLPERYRRRLERFRYGPGVFKLDWALDGPIPWAAPETARAGTVHLGGTFDEIVASEAAVARGEHPERPFVLLVQATACDPTRAPAGRHTGWAYCHVPHGSTGDMTAAIEAQVERFAPGFSRLILARSAMDSAEVERRNANYIGGDINGGLQDWRQLFALRYRTPLPGVFLCSSSTPPGGGVHGMCGYWAARAALRQ